MKAALVTFSVLSLVLSAQVSADGHGHGHHKHHKHHGHHDRYVEVERIYYPKRVVQYVPVAPAPVVPMPVPRYHDQRTAGGLVGGVVGSAVGYEASHGDPIGAGIGAAAGAWVGNGLSR
jgi:hypothetical protein